MGKRRRCKTNRNDNVEIWTEEQYEDYLKGLYDMEFIAGFTDNGVPYGIFSDEFDITDTSNDSDEEIPF